MQIFLWIVQEVSGNMSKYFLRFRKGSRRDLNSEISHIWKVHVDRRFIFHPIFNSYNCKMRQMFKVHSRSSKVLFPLYYCVKQNTVSTLDFYIHLFNFPLSTCCGNIMLLLAYCFKLYHRNHWTYQNEIILPTIKY
jgi:hypothetical protein